MTSRTLPPQAAKIIQFIQTTFDRTHKSAAVIAVSGGIDSALVLYLLSQALPKEQIWPILLPYGQQDMTDAQTIVDFCQIPTINRKVLNITSMVDASCRSLQVEEADQVRKGNIMARSRMITIFDYAKVKEALVVGTENKSEHYLGYFTRFGDQASDLEPILSLYKTQVRQLASDLNLPAVFLQKVPSAGLWAEQSDEAEFGFSYELADQVLEYLFDQHRSEQEILQLFDPKQGTSIKKILQRVKTMAFKQQVPYTLSI